MKKIWEHFENLGEIVYVADMDSYEIEYMNCYALKQYGFESLDSVKGRKCYELLQNLSAPCTFCTNRFLKPGDFYEWKYVNPVVGRSFSLKDTMVEDEGRRMRMEFAFDMSEQDAQSKTIKTLMLTEAAINEALRASLREPDTIRSIEVFLEYLGRNFNGERVYIFEERENRSVWNTFEWCAEGVVPQIENLQDVPFEAVELWYEYFNSQKNVIITDLEATKETDPNAYEYLKPQDIHSLVVSPLISEEKIIGFYGVDNPPAELLEHISDISWIVGHFIVSLLKKRELMANLEHMSYYDQLTGLRNRHAMQELISSGNNIDNMGVVYCDIMGLKNVNDSLGHKAGDELILRAADCLKDNFRLNDLYRIGGDEFLVLCGRIDKDDFFSRVDKLRLDMKKNDAVMAIGSLWRAETGDMDALIAMADKLMYKEKQKYYAIRDKGGRMMSVE